MTLEREVEVKRQKNQSKFGFRPKKYASRYDDWLEQEKGLAQEEFQWNVRLWDLKITLISEIY